MKLWLVFLILGIICIGVFLGTLKVSEDLMSKHGCDVLRDRVNSYQSYMQSYPQSYEQMTITEREYIKILKSFDSCRKTHGILLWQYLCFSSVALGIICMGGFFVWGMAEDDY